MKDISISTPFDSYSIKGDRATALKAASRSRFFTVYYGNELIQDGDFPIFADSARMEASDYQYLDSLT